MVEQNQGRVDSIDHLRMVIVGRALKLEGYSNTTLPLDRYRRGESLEALYEEFRVLNTRLILADHIEGTEQETSAETVLQTEAHTVSEQVVPSRGFRVLQRAFKRVQKWFSNK